MSLRGGTTKQSRSYTGRICIDYEIATLRNDIREHLPYIGVFTNIFLPTLPLVLTKKIRFSHAGLIKKLRNKNYLAKNLLN